MTWRPSSLADSLHFIFTAPPSSLHSSVPLLAPLASALSALLASVRVLSSSAASLSQLIADARLLISPASSGGEGGDGADGLLPRLCLGSVASCSAALDSLASSIGSLPASSAATAVSAVSAMLDSGDLFPASHDKAMSMLVAFASSDAACRFLAQESGTVLPHLYLALESSGAGAEHSCVALHPLTAASRDAAAAVAACGGVAVLLAACTVGTPAAQAVAAGVLRNLAAFPDLLPAFRDEGAPPLLLQLVSLSTPRAKEHALGYLQNLTACDIDEGQRLKIEAFQEDALGCVKDFLESSRTDESGLAPAFGLLRNMASFRYIAEIAVSASFVGHVVTALGCPQNLTACDSDEGQRLKVEAFQEYTLGCVKDFLESSRGDEPSLAPAFGLLRNMASFRYIAEIAVSASFVGHVVAALGSDKANTRTEAVMALAELWNAGSGKARRSGHCSNAIRFKFHRRRGGLQARAEEAAPEHVEAVEHWAGQGRNRNTVWVDVEEGDAAKPANVDAS